MLCLQRIESKGTGLEQFDRSGMLFLSVVCNKNTKSIVQIRSEQQQKQTRTRATAG